MSQYYLGVNIWANGLYDHQLNIQGSTFEKTAEQSFAMAPTRDLVSNLSLDRKSENQPDAQLQPYQGASYNGLNDEHDFSEEKAPLGELANFVSVPTSQPSNSLSLSQSLGNVDLPPAPLDPTRYRASGVPPLDDWTTSNIGSDLPSGVPTGPPTPEDQYLGFTRSEVDFSRFLAADTFLAQLCPIKCEANQASPLDETAGQVIHTTPSSETHQQWQSQMPHHTQFDVRPSFDFTQSPHSSGHQTPSNFTQVPHYSLHQRSFDLTQLPHQNGYQMSPDLTHLPHQNVNRLSRSDTFPPVYGSDIEHHSPQLDGSFLAGELSSKPRRNRGRTYGSKDPIKQEEDRRIVELRDGGKGFQEILDIMISEGFVGKMSTIRGRYRNFIKPAEERLRKPVWQDRDVSYE